MDRFSEAQNWLKELSSEAQFFRKGLSPSLEIFTEFLDALGKPDEFFDYRIVIGGTAGKGTVCRLTEDVLVQSGKKVALIVSPHIQVVTERIQLGGKIISKDDFAMAILTVKETAQKLNKRATYYETCVLAGIWAAKKWGAEILICEVGCGGEKDAVNAVRGKRIAAVTFIGDDHREILGGTLEKIAETKAGIFTKDSVLNLSFEHKYYSILESVAKSKIHYVKGIKQKLNKKLARKICEKVLERSDFEMRKIPMPCRWEVVSEKLKVKRAAKEKKIILDGAHSTPRFEYIEEKVKKLTGKKIAVFGMAKNHDPSGFKILEKYFDEIIWTELPGERGFWEAKELQKMFGRGLTEKDPHKALETAKQLGDTILVLGSFYLGGEIRNEFYSPEDIQIQRTNFPKRDSI
jgi:folylpolyglutamate synthase/dihydropteroate synthase